MPQLNPNPWFSILFFSWIVLISLVPMKVLNHKFPNSPSVLSSKPVQTKFWHWPWH